MFWRDILYGVLLFPIALVLGTIANPGSLLVAGVPSGVIAARRSNGFVDGFGVGALAGVLLCLLVAVGGTYFYLQDPPVSDLPGFGLAMVYVWAILLGIESTAGGAITGYVVKTT